VPEISGEFDDFWNNDIAYPAAGFAKHSDAEEELRAKHYRARQGLRQELENSRSTLISYPMQPQTWDDWLATLEDELDYGEAHFLQDQPVDIKGKAMRLADMLGHIAEPTVEELLIVSPYLIPAGDLLENLGGLNSRGIAVRVLTASMGSNNHTAAHSHYKKYRKPILDTGSALYEARHDLGAEMREFSDVAPVTAKFISLHTKAFVADRERCFIGSLNLDPRALEINTENGLYIESPQFAAQLAERIDQMMAPANAWQVLLDETGRIRWQSATGTLSRQPARSGTQRFSDFFLRLLPIEKQL